VSNKRKPPRRHGESGDPWLDPEWRAYETRVRTEVLPKVEGSAMGVSIVPTSPDKVDVKFAVELGMMIMLDKPIILCVHPTTLLPEKLRRIADEIVVYGGPEDQEAMIAAIDRVGKKLEENDA
jgi:hypothetical protein